MSELDVMDGIEPLSLVRAPEETSDFPGLTRVGAQIARGLADTLAANGCAGAKIRCEETIITTFEEWRGHAEETRAVCHYRMGALKGGMLLAMPQGFVSRLVDMFYGGDGDLLGSRKELSAAEERYFVRLCDTMAGIIAHAWADMASVDVAAVKCDHGGSIPTLVTATRQIVVQGMIIERPGAKPVSAEIVYPLAMLRSVPQLQAVPEAEEAPHVDSVWQERLSDAILNVRLPLRTVFARPELPLSQLLNLKAGDIIPVCLPNHVPVTVAGRVFAHASVGDSNGRTAIKIERIEEGSAIYE